MMESTDSGAPSAKAPDWDQIDWKQAERVVDRLQARIVKATHEGRWNKVRALQHLLTHSRSGKLLAVKRVSENRGKRTPGVDGETWSTPRRRMAAVDELRRRGYKPKPLRRVYIPKRSGKMRPLSIPTMTDRAMQALYLLALSPIAETTADPSSYGFRPKRSTADAIAACFGVLSQRRAAQWVLEGDIRSCFDRISHQWLLTNVPTDTAILRRWLQAGFMEHAALFLTRDGTPQGGIISPVLANLALDGLQPLLKQRFPGRRAPGSRRKVYQKINLVRYADDFIITGASREVLETEVRPLVEEFLARRGLELSPDKTVVTHIGEGFDFLGQHIRKYNGKLLIKPSQASMCSVRREVARVVKSSGSLTAGQVIARLNPLLRGWAYYHRHAVSSRAFRSLDHYVRHTLHRWAKRRHPKRSSAWLLRRYYRPHAGRSHVFTGTAGASRGHAQVWLFHAASVPIRRHMLVRGTANPFDPAWTTYFRLRQRSTLLARQQPNRFSVSPRPVMEAAVEA